MLGRRSHTVTVRELCYLHRAASRTEALGLGHGRAERGVGSATGIQVSSASPHGSSSSPKAGTSIVPGFGRVNNPPPVPREALSPSSLPPPPPAEPPAPRILKGSNLDECAARSSVCRTDKPPREPKPVCASVAEGLSVSRAPHVVSCGRCGVPSAVAAPVQDADMIDEPNTQELHEPGRPGDPATQLAVDLGQSSADPVVTGESKKALDHGVRGHVPSWASCEYCSRSRDNPSVQETTRTPT